MILILIFAEALALYGLIGKHFSMHLLRITGSNAAALSQHMHLVYADAVPCVQLVSFWLQRLASQLRCSHHS